MRSIARPDIFRLGVTCLEFSSNPVNAVDENLLSATPYEDTLDDLVNAREPALRGEDWLIVVVVGCGA